MFGGSRKTRTSERKIAEKNERANEKSAEASGLRACRVQINNLLSQETWGEVYLSPTLLRGPSPKSHLAASEVTWLKLEVAWLKMEVMWLEMEVKTATKRIFKPNDFQTLET